MLLEEKFEQMAAELRRMRPELTALRVRVRSLEKSNESFERKLKRLNVSPKTDQRIQEATGQKSTTTTVTQGEDDGVQTISETVETQIDNPSPRIGKAEGHIAIERTNGGQPQNDNLQINRIVEDCRDKLPRTVFPALTNNCLRSGTPVITASMKFQVVIPTPIRSDGGKGFGEEKSSIERNTEKPMDIGNVEKPKLTKNIKEASTAFGKRLEIENLRPFGCDFCGKRFRKKVILAEHIRIHSGEKNHVCEQCGRGFLRSRALVEHIRIHSGEKTYVCDQCGKAFNQRSALYQHAQTHMPEKRPVCDQCGKTFSRKSSLVKHSLTHSGEQKHFCNLCGKGFYRKNRLESHERSHLCGKI